MPTKLMTIKSKRKDNFGEPVEVSAYYWTPKSKLLGVLFGHFAPFTGKYGHARLIYEAQKYGIEDFFELSEEPDVEKYFYRDGIPRPLYNIHTIAGTCIAKDKAKSTIYLLTTSGVVTVKFRKEYFSLFDKQLSEKQEDGTKKVVEKSWFNRGNMLIIKGIRRGDDFLPKKYASTEGHQLYKIQSIDENGDIIVTNERALKEEE
jgi:hypothetical protein